MISFRFKNAAAGNGVVETPALSELDFQTLKAAIHEELVESLDLGSLGSAEEEQLGAQIRSVAAQLCRLRSGLLDQPTQQRMLDELMDEVFGLGPLERLMRDPSVDDILVNGPHEVYVERRGRLEHTEVIFADDQHLMRVIRRVVARIGRRIDEVTPMVDARLPDGSRLNAIVPPLALKGPTLSIRRFGARPLGCDDLVSNRSVQPEMFAFLTGAVQSRLSMLIAGGTGAGKTTMLNALSASIPNDERLVTIEDSAELKLQHKHVIQLETRVANTEGAGEVSQRDLLRNSLRMRPDRILVGEVRGAEALDMLQAMNTGHEGSLTTIHANDTRDALTRLEMMVAMAGFELPVPVVRQYIASGIKIVVQLARLKGGARRVSRISEIVGVENGAYRLEDIFGFEQTGLDGDGNAAGEFYATGYKPQCLTRLKAAGIELPAGLFEARRTAV
jgi:pilus assembly protein CpaF